MNLSGDAANVASPSTCVRSGRAHYVSAKTRSWDEAERVAQGERDKRDPVKFKLRKIAETHISKFKPLCDALEQWLAGTLRSRDFLLNIEPLDTLHRFSLLLLGRVCRLHYHIDLRVTRHGSELNWINARHGLPCWPKYPEDRKDEFAECRFPLGS
jgi:hypothetical protein